MLLIMFTDGSTCILNEIYLTYKFKLQSYAILVIAKPSVFGLILIQCYKEMVYTLLMRSDGLYYTAVIA